MAVHQHALAVMLVTWLCISEVTAYPSYMPCDRSLTTGTSIMGAPAGTATSTVEFRRSGAAISGTYAPGETLTAHWSGSGSWILEVSGGTISGGLCSGRRSTSSGKIIASRNTHNHSLTQRTTGASITAPASGSLSLWGGQANGYGTVYITSTDNRVLGEHG